jgi:hypothetical protein
MSDDRKPFGIGPIRLPSGNALTCSLCGEKVGECIHTTELQHGQKLKLFAGVLGEGLDVFVDKMDTVFEVGEVEPMAYKMPVTRIIDDLVPSIVEAEPYIPESAISPENQEE